MNSTKNLVLKQLLKQRDTWVSGDDLASQIGVSRESIWKAINSLKRQGNDILSRKNLGYRYSGNPFLDADTIDFYSDHHFENKIIVFKETTSTQDMAKQYLSTHTISSPVIFLADHQTKGYGRRGRSFYSPAQTGLYLSIILPNPDHQLFQVGLLTTSISVVIARVLEQFYPEKKFQLKWVNDVYLDQHKVAGIITEAVLDLESSTAAHFILGVGINLSTQDFPEDLGQIAQAIDPTIKVDRNQLAAALIQHITKTAVNYTAPDLLKEYRKRSLILDKKVTLQLGNTSVFGTAKQIKDDGGLVIQDDHGKLHTFNSGEVIKLRWA